MDQFDLLVVGAGPTGLATAIEAGRSGLSSVVIEKGCVVNSLFHYPINMVFFTTPELLEIGDIPMVSVRDKPTRNEALKYYRLVAQHFGIHIHQYEEVREIRGADGHFIVETCRRDGAIHEYGAKKLVLATGYYDRPNLLGIPGENLPKVSHYYKEAHPFYNCDVAVIGAQNSAAIAALELYRHGARVTLIHRGARLSEKIKYWIKPDIENRIHNGEIQARFETRVVEVRPDSLLLAPASGAVEQRAEELPNDFVFALTGYHPDLEFLHRTGIAIQPPRMRPCCDSETRESNVPGIYLAGVIIAGLDTNEIFIENGRFHGQQIVKDITAKLERKGE